jgi:hypothetical protein
MSRQSGAIVSTTPSSSIGFHRGVGKAANHDDHLSTRTPFEMASHQVGEGLARLNDESTASARLRCRCRTEGMEGPLFIFGLKLGDRVVHSVSRARVDSHVLLLHIAVDDHFALFGSLSTHLGGDGKD